MMIVSVLLLMGIAFTAGFAVASSRRNQEISGWACRAQQWAGESAAKGIRVQCLEQAIRRHRDYQGDDRCWMDDEELYKVLPEGYTVPKRSVAVELAHCQDFLRCRRNPKTEYISPQREIERLKEVIRVSYAGTEKDYWVWQGDGTDHLGSLVCPLLISADEMRRLLAVAACKSSSSETPG